MKASLTFEEKVTAAYLHYAHGVEQQLIAIAMGVNMGRVNEACLAIKTVLEASSHNVMYLRERNERGENSG